MATEEKTFQLSISKSNISKVSIWKMSQANFAQKLATDKLLKTYIIKGASIHIDRKGVTGVASAVEEPLSTAAITVCRASAKTSLVK